jgi:ABC-type glucose/galactose transport system permease subunit
MKAANEIKFEETFVNRENFEALRGYIAGVLKSGSWRCRRKTRAGRIALSLMLFIWNTTQTTKNKGHANGTSDR